MFAPVLALSISPSRCPPEPLPFEAKLRPPGFDLASATSSETERAGRSGGTASSCGKPHISVIGRKSLIGSYGSVGYSDTLAAWVAALAWNRVCPSGGACLTAAAAIAPPPPGRDSTTRVCPVFSLTFLL